MGIRSVAGLVAGALFLSACAGAEITQPPVPYTPTQVLNERGTTTFAARTYTEVNGRRSEISGVPCTFQGAGFKSSFQTPAAVIAPNMQLRTPPASVTCTYNGVTKSQVLSPYNKTVADINATATSAGAGAGLIGLLVGGAIATAQAASRDTSLDVYAYPDAAVAF